MACSTLNARTTTASWKFKVLDGDSFKRFPETHYIRAPTSQGLKQTIISTLEKLPLYGQNVIALFWAPTETGSISLLLTTTYQPSVIYGNNEELASYHEAFLQQKYFIDRKNHVACGLPGKVWLTCKPEQTQHVHGYPEDERPRGQYAFFDRTWGSFCVPVILGDRCVGVLEFVTDNLQDSYDNDIAVVCKALEDAGFQTSTQTEPPKVTNIIRQKSFREREATPFTKYCCLVPYFGLSGAEAADRLGQTLLTISKGTFRNMCKRVGISEWPWIPKTTRRTSSFNDIDVVRTALENAGSQTSTQIEHPNTTKKNGRKRTPSSQFGHCTRVAAGNLKCKGSTFKNAWKNKGIYEWQLISNTTTRVSSANGTQINQISSSETSYTAHGTQIHQISSSETSSTANGAQFNQISSSETSCTAKGTQINQISREASSFGTAYASDDISDLSEFIENTNPDFLYEKTTIVRVSSPDTSENISSLSELIENINPDFLYEKTTTVRVSSPDTSENISSLSELIENIASPSETQNYHIALDEDWIERERERSNFMQEFNDDLFDQSNEAPELMGDSDPVEIFFNSDKWENDQVQRFEPIPFPC